MPISTLDPKTALLVIDLQKGILSYPTVHPVHEVVRQASALADAFRRHGLPVVLVNVTGGAPGRTDQARPRGPFPEGFADLAPELNRQEQDHLVTKQTWGAFTGTDLAGVATSIGVESTARQASELGFNVALAVDAMTDLNSDAHVNSITRIFPRLGETGPTQEIVRLLDERNV